MASLEERIKELCERTGYPIDVHPGQRRYGPPTDLTDTVPPKDAEVFIGKIPKDLFEDELVPMLEECGPIFDIRLMMDTENSIVNKGYAFVRMVNKEGAAQCVEKLDKFAIRPGKELGVCISQSNSRLFIAGIPKNKSKDEILTEFSTACKGVIDVVFYADPKDLNKNRGFCFIDFDSHGNASTCRKRIASARFSIWNKTNLVCEWAIPQDEPDRDVMSKVKTLFVKHIAECVQQKDLEDLFNNYGQVEKINRIKDYAFVFFMERVSALSAIESTDGFNLKGSHLSVSLAKPAAKQKDVIPRGGYRHGEGNEGYNRQFGRWEGSEFGPQENYGGPPANDNWHGPSDYNDDGYGGGTPMVSYPPPQSSTGPMWRGRGANTANKRGMGGMSGNRDHGGNNRRGSFGGNNDRRGSFTGNNEGRGGFGGNNDRRGRGGFGGNNDRRGSFGGNPGNNYKRGGFGGTADKNSEGSSGYPNNQSGGYGGTPTNNRSGYEESPKRGRGGGGGGGPSRGPVRGRGGGPQNMGRGSGGGPSAIQPQAAAYNQNWSSGVQSGNEGYEMNDYPSGYGYTPSAPAPARPTGHNSGRGGYASGSASSWNEDYSLDSWQGQTTYGKRPPSDLSGPDSKRAHYQPPPPPAGGHQNQYGNAPYNSGHPPPASGQWNQNTGGQAQQWQGYGQNQWK